MTLTAFAQQPLAAPQAVTDPTKLESKNVADMQNFSIEKLYMTRQIGGTTWSPDGKQVAFISNISGRNNLWMVPATGGWPTQLTISDQRQVAAGVVAGRHLDRLHLRPRRRRAVGHLPGLAQDRRRGEPDDFAGVRRESSRHGRPTADSIAYATKPKTGSSYEIELMDVATRHVTHLTKNTPKELSN